MRTIFPQLSRTALILTGAFLATACGGDAETDNAANGLDSNIMFEQLGNDASALEQAGNASIDYSTDPGTGNDSESEPGANAATGNSSGDERVFGETSGGDTGGNTVDRNSQ
jgi:hypothetical protein